MNGSPVKVELSARERDVLRGLSEGLVCKQIAADLDISLHTVRTYVRRIFQKLEVESLPQAVGLAARRGWLDPASAQGRTRTSEK